MLIPRVDSVRYELPDGYRGYFWLVSDPREGEDVKVVNGVARVRVPPGGIAKVKSLRFLEQPHKNEAATYSGTQIQTNTDDRREPGAMIVQEGETIVDQRGSRYVLFVGKEGEGKFNAREPGDLEGKEFMESLRRQESSLGGGN